MKSSNYTVGDFIIRLKNISLAGKRDFSLPKTKLIKEVAQALKRERYLEKVEEDGGEIKISLARKNKTSLISDLEIISRPGRRVYMGVDELESNKGPFIFILSTPQGVISSKEAIKKRVGGEVIAKIW